MKIFTRAGSKSNEKFKPEAAFWDPRRFHRRSGSAQVITCRSAPSGMFSHSRRERRRSVVDKRRLSAGNDHVWPDQ